MPDPAQRNSQIVAMVMIGSAVALVTLAGLIYARVIEIGDDVRMFVAAMLGAVGLLDFFLGAVFFNKGKSS